MAMRRLLNDNVSQMIDRLQAEYENPATSDARKQAIFREGQDALTMAMMTSQAASPHNSYVVPLFHSSMEEPLAKRVTPEAVDPLHVQRGHDPDAQRAS